MRPRTLATVALGLAALASATVVPSTARAQPPPAASTPSVRELRPPTAFARIADPAARSIALFAEVGKVFQHPRCLNCHPGGDRPTQGTGYPHQPPVQRGADGLGVTARRRTTCHQVANFDPGRVPGVSGWQLAPASMGWRKRSLAEICAQLKDQERNGGRSLTEIVTHVSHDPLVGWAWTPGAAREPAPGTQASFVALIKAWVESGGVCPAR